MSKISVLVHGLGNIGQCVLEAIETSPDMECLGVIRRKESLGKNALALRGVKDFASLEQLVAAKGLPQVAIICGPSREVPKDAAFYLHAGLNTADSFDIHGDIPLLLKDLQAKATKAGKVSVLAAGWDPGTDSVLRALFEAMAPIGTTFTNFGRGRSMGHSVAARSIEGVLDATSITIPLGGGKHARLVYILAKNQNEQNKIKDNIAKDPYFSHDPLDVRFVNSKEELASVADNSHGVLMERLGASGLTSNQRLSFDMRINNPALTAQVLVSAARASTRMTAGAYTLIDIPPVHLLAGERLTHIARLV